MIQAVISTAAQITPDHAMSMPIICTLTLSDTQQQTLSLSMLQHSWLLGLHGQRMPAAVWLDLNPSNVGLVCTDLHANIAAV